MFEITYNDFVNSGVIRYEDEYGNKAIMTRIDGGFRAKIRFNDKKVRAQMLEIQVPVKDDISGTTLHVDYLDGHKHENADVTNGVSAFSKLIQHWISMLYDVNFLNFDTKMFKKFDQLAVAQYKMGNLMQYEELVPYVKQVLDSKMKTIVS